MLEGIKNIRGIAQSFLRGAVALGQTVTETVWNLKEVGLGYLDPDMRSDYDKFAKQDFITGEISLLDPKHLIPGDLHVESTWDLTAKYKYDVEGIYVDAEGNTQTASWSVIDDNRLTQVEITDIGATYTADSAPEGWTLVGDVTLIGSWTKRGREL